jgi:outer membrane protein OmpA-like peptidoglycan-associated protein
MIHATRRTIMKNAHRSRIINSLAMTAAGAFLATACATSTPVELSNARVAYGRASSGPAAQLVPSDVHKAKVALDLAEKTFADGNDRPKAVDLAYIAERTAQIAEAHAVTAIAEKKTSKANQEFGTKQGEIVKNAQGDLAKTRVQLGEAERGQAQQTQLAGVERAAREDADRKAAASAKEAKEANEALAKLAAKEDARGMVITLSGSVLFRTNDATLLPGAQTRLDEVATALVAKKQDVVIEGYTDSRGSQSTNMSLSQRRAESVRGYLVSRGFPAEKISAKGMGPERPIAENGTAEGRANNRRVEIVIAKAPSGTN